MTTDEAKEIIFDVLSLVAPEVSTDEIDHDVDLSEQLDLDSMDYLNWLIGISETTGIEISQRDASRFLTIDGAAVYLLEFGIDSGGISADSTSDS
jgi:acyl carrier protein